MIEEYAKDVPEVPDAAPEDTLPPPAGELKVQVENGQVENATEMDVVEVGPTQVAPSAPITAFPPWIPFWRQELFGPTESVI